MAEAVGEWPVVLGGLSFLTILPVHARILTARGGGAAARFGRRAAPDAEGY